jgi:hypothetical protein
MPVQLWNEYKLELELALSDGHVPRRVRTAPQGTMASDCRSVGSWARAHLEKSKLEPWGLKEMLKQ